MSLKYSRQQETKIQVRDHEQDRTHFGQEKSSLSLLIFLLQKCLDCYVDTHCYHSSGFGFWNITPNMAIVSIAMLRTLHSKQIFENI